jgi:hypothetical protein
MSQVQLSRDACERHFYPEKKPLYVRNTCSSDTPAKKKKEKEKLYCAE